MPNGAAPSTIILKYFSERKPLAVSREPKSSLVHVTPNSAISLDRRRRRKSFSKEANDTREPREPARQNTRPKKQGGMQ